MFFDFFNFGFLQTLGNHEFDFGPDVLLEHVKSLNYPVLSANFEAQGHELGNYIRRYTIINVKSTNILKF